MATISPAIVATWDLPNHESSTSATGSILLNYRNPGTNVEPAPIDTRTLVNPKHFKPGGKYRSIVKLFIKYERDKTKEAMGTGWLIAPDVLVTAGHNAYDWSLELRRAIEVRAYIGYDGEDSVKSPNVQLRYVTKIATTVGWLLAVENKCKDFAVMKLERPFDGVIPFNWINTPMTGPAQLGVVGYPGDRFKATASGREENGAQMYEMFVPTSINRAGTDQHMLDYTISTYAGQSGSPVLMLQPTTGNLVSIGIHTYSGIDVNSATVIGGPSEFGNPLDEYAALFAPGANTANATPDLPDLPRGIRFVTVSRRAGVTASRRTEGTVSRYANIPIPHRAEQTTFQRADIPIPHRAEQTASQLADIPIPHSAEQTTSQRVDIPIPHRAEQAASQLADIPTPHSAEQTTSQRADIPTSLSTQDAVPQYTDVAISRCQCAECSSSQNADVSISLREEYAISQPAEDAASYHAEDEIPDTVSCADDKISQPAEATVSYPADDTISWQADDAVSQYTEDTVSWRVDDTISQSVEVIVPCHATSEDTISRTAEDIVSCHVEDAFLPDAQGFSDVLKDIIKVALPIARTVVPAPLPFLGSIGPIIAPIAGIALNAASKLTRSEIGPESENRISKAIATEGVAERAILGEAALQAILRIPKETLVQTGALKKMAHVYSDHASVVKRVAPRITGAVLETGFRIAVDEIRISKNPIDPVSPKTAVLAGTESLLSAAEAGIDHPFLQGIVSPTAIINEGFFDRIAGVLKKGLTAATPIVDVLARAGLDKLDQAITAERTVRSEAFLPQPDSILNTVAQRALVAEAALQALIELPPDVLNEEYPKPSDPDETESLFDVFKNVVQTIGPRVLDAAPVTIKILTPIIKDLLTKSETALPLPQTVISLPPTPGLSPPADKTLRRKKSRSLFEEILDTGLSADIKATGRISVF